MATVVKPYQVGHQEYMRAKFAEEKQQAEDLVNNPPHYTQGQIECIDAIRAALGSEGFMAFCRGNSMKYLWRYNHKGGKQDLEKAVWYTQKLIAENEKDEK